MKIIRSSAGPAPDYPIETIAPAEKLLFFDIETTGFSPASSFLYLIGCLYYETSSTSWQMIQWFSEALEEEVLLLRSFFAFLKPYTVFLHYNGDAFDLAFIRSRCQLHGLDCPLSEKQSLDLYKKIRPWKNALSLPSLKQKALEKFLGRQRAESFTGRQLIAAYQDYLTSRKNALSHLLLLHNQEDLRGLFQLLPLLAYTKLPEFTFSLTRQTMVEGKEETEEKNNWYLELFYHLSLSLPLPFRLEGPFFTISGQYQEILCSLPMYRGELKYFYPDVENYYYLPCEDMAIHKSVGSYVAGSARKKATPKNCYTRKTGLFFPQPSALIQPAFQQDVQGRPFYAEYQKERFSDPKTADDFLHQIFLLLPVFP